MRATLAHGVDGGAALQAPLLRRVEWTCTRWRRLSPSLPPNLWLRCKEMRAATATAAQRVCLMLWQQCSRRWLHSIANWQRTAPHAAFLPRRHGGNTLCASQQWLLAEVGPARARGGMGLLAEAMEVEAG